MPVSDINQRFYLICPANWLGQKRPFHDLVLLNSTVLNKLLVPSSEWAGAYVVAVPSAHFEIHGVAEKLPDPEREVVQFVFTEQQTLDSFLIGVRTLSASDPTNGPQAGADLPFIVSNYVDYWCPIGAGAAGSAARRSGRSRRTPWP